MDSFIVHYIAQRMAHLGFRRYAYEPVLVIVPDGQSEYTLEGVNEYYYLASRVLATGIEIEGDNNYFKADANYVNLDYSRFQEFTGRIRVTFPQGVKQALEFIRVIPQ
jgi:hypothetical protein